jgi:septum formation topological specificity factor MinE
MINWSAFFKRSNSTAPVARERLQILLAHEAAALIAGAASSPARRSKGG